MSGNWYQKFLTNPITSNNTGDLLYFARSPYGISNDGVITWANFSSQFLQPANNLSDVDNVSTARTNLGLGSIATQSAAAVNITGGSASFVGSSTLAFGFVYVELVGSAVLAVTQSNVSFNFTASGITLSDGLGLGSFTNGFQFILKNTSAGNCTFQPHGTDKIDGASSLTIAPGQGFLIEKLSTEWGIIASNFDLSTPIGVTQGGTGLSSTTINQLLFSSANNVIAGLTTSVNGTLVTDSGGAPSISSTLPSAVQTNITKVGTVTTGTWSATPITVNNGGTGKTTFTAYSVICAGTTATGIFQNVVGVGTSGFILTSNGAGALPTWQANPASGTVNTGTINQLAWYAASGTVVSGLATANNAMLVTSATGVPSLSSTLGQGLAISSSVLNVGGTNNIPFNSGSGIQDSNSNNLLTFTTSASAVNYFAMKNASTGGDPSLLAVGTDSNIGLILGGKGTGQVVLVNAGGGVNLAVFAGNSASDVNYLAFNASTTGSGPSISAVGSDTNVPLLLGGQGTGGVTLLAGITNLAQFVTVASAVDFFTFNAAATGNPATVQIQASGTDSNINFEISPKGTGLFQLGNSASFSANGSVATLLGSLGPTGSHTTVQTWLTFLDSGGIKRWIPCF